MRNVYPDEAVEGRPGNDLPAGETEAAIIRDGLEGQVVCPFCGVISDGSQPICPKCTMENSAVARKATKLRIGPWYVLQNRNPAAPGMKWETLLSFVRKGRVKPQSIVRGPSTHQLWRFAAHVKGLSREFGVCYSCGGSVERGANLCPHCNRLQEPPAYPDTLLESNEPDARTPVYKEVDSQDIQREPVAAAASEAELAALREVKEKEMVLAREQREAMEREREALEREKEAATFERDLVQREQEALARERDAILREKELMEKDRGVLERERDLLRHDREAASTAAREATAAHEAVLRESATLRENALRETSAARDAREAALRESNAARDAREAALRESAAAREARDAAAEKEMALARELASMRQTAARELAAAKESATASKSSTSQASEGMLENSASMSSASTAHAPARPGPSTQPADDMSVWDMGEMDAAKPSFRPTQGSRPMVQIAGTNPLGQKAKARDGFLSPKDLAAAFRLNPPAQEGYDIAARHSEASVETDSITAANLSSLGEPPAAARKGGGKGVIIFLLLVIVAVVALVASPNLRQKAWQTWNDLSEQPSKPPPVGAKKGQADGGLSDILSNPPAETTDNSAPPVLSATTQPATRPASVVAPTSSDRTHAQIGPAAESPNATAGNAPASRPSIAPGAIPAPSPELMAQASMLVKKAREAEVQLDYPEAVKQLEQLKKLPRVDWPGDVEFELEMDRKLAGQKVAGQ